MNEEKNDPSHKRQNERDKNLAAAKLELTDEEILRLDELSALPPEYPGWMVEFQKHERLAP